jgi:predicted PurR-regulated permease PerM
MNRWLILGTALALCGVLFLLGPVLTPFLLGLAMAYVCRPAVCFLHRRTHISITLSSFFLTLGLYVVIISGLFFLIPSLKNISFFLSERLAFYRLQLWELAYPWITKLSAYSKEMAKIQESLDSLIVLAANWIGTTLMHLFENGLSVARFFLTVLMAPLIAFHVMKDWGTIVVRFMDLLPSRYRRSAQRLLGELDEALSCYVRGQWIICGVLSGYYGLMLWAVGLDFGLILGVGTGFFAFIPYLGFFLGLLASLIVAVVQGGSFSYCMTIFCIFLGGQILEAVFLTPHLIGKKTGMHPVFILFVVCAGAALAGFIGVLMALPMATLFVAGLRFLKSYYYRSRFYTRQT